VVLGRPGAMAAVAGLLVVATAPRSNQTSASLPAPPSPSTEARVIANAAETCRGLDDSGVSSHPIPFPARTAAELIVGAQHDPSIRLLLNDLAGARPWSMREPQCHPEALELGQPVFVRQYPAATGTWLIALRYHIKRSARSLCIAG